MSSEHRNQAASTAKIVVLSGPSGSGKSTIVKQLLKLAPVKLRKMISVTTRPKRVNEVDGKDYYFLSKLEFEQKKEEDQFLEWAEVFGSGYFYGTLKSEIDRALQDSTWAFLEIDVQGALEIMREYPQTVSIFLKTSSLHEYESRLRNRGTEAEEFIQKRLATAAEELKLSNRYSYTVINDNLDEAVEEIANILKSYEAN